jgi:benzoylformate decarboxylase
LWSAAHYRVGVLFVILSNGGYAIMDRLAERTGERAPWPSFEEVELATVARGFGCPARRIDTHEELVAALDDVVPTLASREEPLLLDVAIEPTQHFAP